MKGKRVALGRRLRHSPLVQTLGLRPNFEDYSEIELDLLRNADTIYYPSTLYEDIFLALGKRVFPANYYRYMGDKIKQPSSLLCLVSLTLAPGSTGTTPGRYRSLRISPFPLSPRSPGVPHRAEEFSSFAAVKICRLTCKNTRRPIFRNTLPLTATCASS